jgi:hypothetical protein
VRSSTAEDRLLVTSHSVSRTILHQTACLFTHCASLPSVPGPELSAARDRAGRRAGQVAARLAGIDDPEGRALAELVTSVRDAVARDGRTLADRLLAWQRQGLDLSHARTGKDRCRGLRGEAAGPPGRWFQVEDALFVPPAAGEVPGLLDELDRWLAAPVEGPAIGVLASGVALHVIMQVQPLGALNELAAHLLALAHLARTGADSGSLFALDRLWSDPGRLFRTLDAGMWSGDLTTWLELFVTCLADEAAGLALEASRAVDRDQVAWLDLAPSLNDRQRRALAIIREQGRITNRDYRRVLGVSNKTAHQELRAMVERKLIRRVGFGRGVAYV